MTTYRIESEGKPMPSPMLTVIDALDAFARQLYRRARNAGSNFETAASVVRDLHTVLKHLRVEAEDPESLLNSDNSAVYIRQLKPITEDADFTLKQLDTILEKYLSNGSTGSGELERGVLVNDSDKGWTMLDTVELEKIDLIRGKLTNQKLHIDMFLDTIQLHNPSKSRQIVDTTSIDLDTMKDKVDMIASRICQRKDSGGDEADDKLWEQFRDALENEGYSQEVLRKHQAVLRAYIREVDEQITTFGGNAPSVRGLLENDMSERSSDDIPSYPAYPAPAEGNEDGIYNPDIDNEKFFPSVKMKRLRYDDYPPQPGQLVTAGTGLSYDYQPSDGQDETSSDLMALISTRDLMALDKKGADLAIAMNNLNMHDRSPPSCGNYITSGSPPQKCLPSSSQPALLPSSEGHGVDENHEFDHDPPPTYVPSLPPPPMGRVRSPPPTLHSNSISAPCIVAGHSAPNISQAPPNQRLASLGPDSQGREIPLDAKWTRIRRSLVSPDVLAREGLRYEARPEFVAVLGELKKDEIADLARKSAELRNSRRQVASNVPESTAPARAAERERRPEDRYHPDKYRNWDVVEGQQDRNGGRGYVINPQHRRRANSAISSTVKLWDSSDGGTSDGLDEHDNLYAGYSNSYTASSQPHSSSYHLSFSPRSSSTQETASVSEDGNDKGTKSYPFIVPPPAEEDKAGSSREKTSPSATVQPKSILKKRNTDPHVRFDPQPQVFNESPRSMPRSLGRRDRGREPNERGPRDRDQDKVRIRDRDRDRDKEKRYQPDRYQDRDREREPRYHGSNGKYHSSTSGGRRGDRDDRSSRRPRQDRDRDRDRERENRKKARSETLRAVGIGGAAASLLSVLTEAAAGL